MNTQLQNLTVQNPVACASAATDPTHLVRLGEAQAMVLTVYQGPWSSVTTYGNGMLVNYGGVLWLSKQGGNLNHIPAENAWWTQVLAGGANGASAYLYVGYAADNTGTSFSLTPSNSLPYVAIKVSTTPISPVNAATFAGLWVRFLGAAGSAGAAGASSYVYVAYASDTSGTGFSQTPDSSLTYIGVKVSATPISPLTAAAFTGLWVQFIGAAGANGTNGSNGASSYVYVAYASDSSGTGFSLTPNDTLPYMAVLVSPTVIASPTVEDFATLWRDCSGPAGADGAAGSAGANGASAFVYVAYASAADGTGFSRTPGAGLTYLGIKTSTTAIPSPAAGDFAGLWTNCVGPAGATGAAGAAGSAGASSYVYVGFASDTSGTGFATTPGNALNYIAFKVSATALTPVAGDFAGLWTLFKFTVPGTAGVLKTDDAGNVAIATADDLEENPVAPSNLYFTIARVMAAALATLDGTATGDLAAGDQLIEALAKLQNRLKNVENAMTSPSQALFYEGTFSLGNGVQSGSVTGLALNFTPSRVQVTMCLPAGPSLALNVAVIGAPTTDGFAWMLTNGRTDSGNYKFYYRIT